MSEHVARQPGDLILDRVIPDAGPEARELAQQRLRQFARVLVYIAMDQVRADTVGTDSHDSGEGITMLPTPPPNV